MLSKRLKSLRDESSLTQEGLCLLLGIKRTTYAQYETGSRTPDIKTLIAIADYYYVSLDYLVDRRDERAFKAGESHVQRS